MEDILNSMISSNRDRNAVKDCLHLMNIYVKNIVEHPENAKYRKIRVSNAKFNRVIWSLEEARTLLLFIGFEQDEESLTLPMGVSLFEFHNLLRKQLQELGEGDQSRHSDAVADNTQPAALTSKPTAVPHLKLGNATGTGNSMFDTEVKPNMTLLSYLVEMGYQAEVAKKALIKTGNQGVQPAMDWIDNHLEEAFAATKSDKSSSSEKNSSNHEAGSSQMSTSPTKETSHVQAPVSRYQKVADQKHQYQEKQRQEAITAAREAKRADKKHKEYLLKNLQAERNLANEKFERQKIARQENHDDAMESDTAQSHPETTVDPMSACARIRVRLIDGKDLNLELEGSSLIGGLYSLVAGASSLSEDTFVLCIPLPPRELTDMSATIQQSELFPTSTLMMKLKNSERKPFESSSQESDPMVDDKVEITEPDHEEDMS